MSQHEMDRPTLGQIHHYYAHAALVHIYSKVIYKIRRLKSMTRSFILVMKQNAHSKITKYIYNQGKNQLETKLMVMTTAKTPKLESEIGKSLTTREIAIYSEIRFNRSRRSVPSDFLSFTMGGFRINRFRFIRSKILLPSDQLHSSSSGFLYF